MRVFDLRARSRNASWSSYTCHCRPTGRRVRGARAAAMGFNHAEAEAAGAAEPKPLPMQMLDYATGHLMAFAASAALWRQMNEGGGWHVRVSLAQTGQWIRYLGRVKDGFGWRGPIASPTWSQPDQGLAIWWPCAIARSFR